MQRGATSEWHDLYQTPHRQLSPKWLRNMGEYTHATQAELGREAGFTAFGAAAVLLFEEHFS